MSLVETQLDLSARDKKKKKNMFMFSVLGRTASFSEVRLSLHWASAPSWSFVETGEHEALKMKMKNYVFIYSLFPNNWYNIKGRLTFF